MSVDLDALEAALAKAAPWPWTVEGPWPNATIYSGEDQVADLGNVDPNHCLDVRENPDAHLIALMRNSMPALVAEVRELRAARDLAIDIVSSQARAHESAAALELPRHAEIAKSLREVERRIRALTTRSGGEEKSE